VLSDLINPKERVAAGMIVSIDDLVDVTTVEFKAFTSSLFHHYLEILRLEMAHKSMTGRNQVTPKNGRQNPLFRRPSTI
jgi:hypothetical protein